MGTWLSQQIANSKLNKVENFMTNTYYHQCGHPIRALRGPESILLTKNYFTMCRFIILIY